VATKKINAGETIFSERPSAFVSNLDLHEDPRVLNGITGIFYKPHALDDEGGGKEGEEKEEEEEEEEEEEKEEEGCCCCRRRRRRRG
jgi:hypothetical protein